MSAPDLDRAISAGAAWMKAEAARLPFGEVSIRLVLHAGRVSRLEKATVEKERPDGGPHHEHAGS
jgi:hypothetical protein